ncbi:MAG: hypothetical protein K6A05_05780 [Lachnospiraceae bacterium]|nr:hypothetical protein [Lachnospiraceae bacterium]
MSVADFLKLHNDGYTEEELRATEDTALMMELLPERANLIRWIPFGGLRVLQLGQCAKALRMELERQQALVDVAEDLSFFDGIEEGYDWILLLDGMDNPTIRSMAYEHYRKVSKESYGDASVVFATFLQHVSESLGEHGRILLLSDNRLGIKYLSSTNQESIPFGQLTETYDEAGQTRFTYSEMQQVFHHAALDVVFYYPYPDGIFPEYIYSDAHLPSGEEYFHNGLAWNNGTRLFDEYGAMRTLRGEGFFREFTSTYLCILQPGKVEVADLATYIKYSTRRKREYAISTELYEPQNGSFCVKKRAFFPEGQEHIAHMTTLQKNLTAALLNTKFQVAMCHGTNDADSVVFDYAKGVSLESLLDESLMRGDVEKTYLQIEKFFAELSRGAKKSFYLMPEFTEVFLGDMPWLGTEDVMLDTTDVDLIFGNVICDNEKWWIIDYEWSFSFPVPFRFLMYRCLYYYVNAKPERKRILGDGIYKRFGLTQEEREYYAKMEENFQNYIYDGHLPLYEEDGCPGRIVGMGAKSPYITEVFYDTSDGFSEDYRDIIRPRECKDYKEVRIPVTPDLVQLRLDPVSLPGVLTIVSVTDEAELPLYYRCNENRKNDKEQYVFAHDDPSICVKVVPGIAEVVIRYQYDAFLTYTPESGVRVLVDEGAKDAMLVRMRQVFDLPLQETKPSLMTRVCRKLSEKHAQRKVMRMRKQKI